MINTVRYYYKSKLASVRDSDIKDVFELAKNVRQADINEIWKSHHKLPENALLEGFTKSVLCFTVERNEKPIIMFGVVPVNILGTKANVWMLASSEIEKIQIAFLKRSRYFIDLMLEYCPYLYNFVDVDNRLSVKWLKWLKAEFSLAIPYGVENKPFYYFEFRKG